MNNTTKYCIVYAVLCLETSERLSVGLITFGDGQCSYRYSQQKLDALEKLLSPKVFNFYCNVVKNLDAEVLKSASVLNYMNRYSNNLLSISEIKSVDMHYGNDTVDWLYNSYIEQPKAA